MTYTHRAAGDDPFWFKDPALLRQRAEAYERAGKTAATRAEQAAWKGKAATLRSRADKIEGKGNV